MDGAMDQAETFEEAAKTFEAFAKRLRAGSVTFTKEDRKVIADALDMAIEHAKERAEWWADQVE